MGPSRDSMEDAIPKLQLSVEVVPTAEVRPAEELVVVTAKKI